ncbi:MAG: hypothetical protein K0R39_3361 [Symbiobacteriaceae bacterium]|jgi:hypothetical protein|nr:hypothetical protein [Symbiobacteriaceae bacterium]
MTDKKSTGSGDQQPQDQKFVAPMAYDPAKAALDAAAKAAHEATLQASSLVNQGSPSVANHLTPSATRGPARINKRKTTRRVTRNLQDPFVWYKSPATLILGVAAKWMAEDNAKARKVKKRRGDVLRIRFGRFENDPHIYLWVTDPKDNDGYDLELVKGQQVINFSDWAFEEDLAPPPGIKQKFDLMETNEPEFGGPVLCFNTEQARKTKTFDPSGGKADEDEDE